MVSSVVITHDFSHGDKKKLTDYCLNKKYKVIPCFIVIPLKKGIHFSLPEKILMPKVYPSQWSGKLPFCGHPFGTE